MSPHVVIPVESKPSLKKFAVTRNAFLPAQKPCELLSDPYYEPWELIAQHLPQLIEENTIKDAVSRLPILSTDRLVSEPEWRRAYVILSFMTHAHVWGGEKPEEVCCFLSQVETALTAKDPATTDHSPISEVIVPP